jgi:hypothetical protein
MDILRNLFGSVTSGIVRLLVTVGILAAAYFFIVKPILDTTESISSQTNSTIQKSFEASGAGNIEVTLENVNRQVERQLQQSLHASRRKGNAQKLVRCLQRAEQDINRVKRCTRRF